MTTLYPGGLDSLTNPASSDPLSSGHAAQHANVNDAVEAIEAELGVNPSGVHATVADRVANVEGAAASLQFAAAGSVLQNLPTRTGDAENLMKQAVLWLDAAHSSASGQTLTNLGWGGSALNATLGSTGSADSNDPKFLDWSGSNYVYSPGSAGNGMTIPHAGTTWPTGDIDIRAYVALDDWTPGSISHVVSRWFSSANLCWVLIVNTGGTLGLWYTTDGTGGTAQFTASTVATGVTDGAAKWIRVTRSSSTGDIKFYLSDDAVTWTQLGSTVTSAAASTFNGTTVTGIGCGPALDSPLSGKVYRAQVLNGISGTPVLDVDTSLVAGNSTSFTALTGQTVTVNRATSGRKTACVTHPVWLFGTDDYMEVADNDLIDFGATDSFTIVMLGRQWATPTNYGKWLNKSNNYPNYAIDTNTTSLQMRFTAIDSGAAHVVAQSTATFTAGQALVVAGVLDRGAVTGSVYLNGTLASSGSAASLGSLANADALRIGRFSGASTSYQDFEFVAAAIFRRALSAAEITTITNYMTGRVGA